MHASPRLLRSPARLARPLLAAAALLAARDALAQSTVGREPYAGLDAYIESARAAWKVPGLAVAIVRNDSLVYARGFGAREAGKAEAVDAQTVFAIGSSSKAFTGLAVAMLADEKTLSLDGKVTAYLPGFQLADPYATRELTVRDLLSHRSGLARGELAWYGSGFDRDEIVRRVRFLEPSWSFRSQFGYQNIMYITAGQVAAKLDGKSWDQLTRDRIFTPLGMRSSSTTIRDLAGVTNLAMPHAEVDSVVRSVPWRNIDNAGPAGSINSNVIDMAQWVRFQLGRGRYAGKQLLSARTFDETHRAHTVIPVDSAARSQNPYTHLQAYALGWFLQDYRGRLVVQHGGNVDGMTALVALLPEEQFGMVILTNMNGTGLPAALMNRIFDHQLGAAPTDWSGNARTRLEQARSRAAAAAARAAAARVPNTRPTLPLEKYAGTYADSLMGEVVVRDSSGTLLLAFGPNWNGKLDHWHYDSFRTRFATPVLGEIPVHFRLGPNASVEELQIDLAGAVTFKRRPAPSPAQASTTR